MMFTEQDKKQLVASGISEESALEQIQIFKKGIPYLKLYSSATLGDGIIPMDSSLQEAALKAWELYSKTEKKIVKFVPASGAASRMFKSLYAFLDADYDAPQTNVEQRFFDGLKSFAFFDDLNACCEKLYHNTISDLLNKGDYKGIVRALLSEEGLSYGSLPKGLLKFHRTSSDGRTAMEEHLVEGALYAINGDGKVRIHFTVSPQHRKQFEKSAVDKSCELAKKYGVNYDISFSEQQASTNTIAVNMDGTPFRNENGELLFRPSGHGALLTNLNSLDADIVFIKNIDNVVSDRMKDDTVLYKKLLAGVLVLVQQQVFAYLKLLESGKYSHSQLLDILHFVENNLCCVQPDIDQYEDSELAIYLKNKLNRPIRVCGMVKNNGEQGGGPFKVYNQDGTISLQILEGSQIDKEDAKSIDILKQSAFFNPVDLVCAKKDYRGNDFDLLKYVDQTAGFISEKSYNGKQLKALELPGLWNGSMSDWNTIFVETPLSTFNPVKEVNDLLREQHQ